MPYLEVSWWPPLKSKSKSSFCEQQLTTCNASEKLGAMF
jgi:hypothetical protein